MDILRGFTAPWLAGLARAIVLAIVGAIIAWLGINANLLPEQVQWAVPLALLVLRQVEALFDQQRVSAGQVIAPTPAPSTVTADAGDPTTLDVQTSREGEPQG